MLHYHMTPPLPFTNKVEGSENLYLLRGSAGFNVNDLNPCRGPQFFSGQCAFYIKIKRNCFTNSFQEISRLCV